MANDCNSWVLESTAYGQALPSQDLNTMFTEILEHLFHSGDQIRETKSSGANERECILVEADLFAEFSCDILMLESLESRVYCRKV